MTDIPMEPVDPQEPPSSPPPAAPPPRTLTERLGVRAARRMTPRIGVAIAGAGAVVAVGGATGLGGDQLFTDDGDVQRIPGVLLSALMIAIGFAVVARVRGGALATGGSTAAALGVPVLLFFLTFSENDFPPFSLDAILLVSSLVWVGAYLIGPVGGRLLFLGAALVGSWLFVVNLVEPVEEIAPFNVFGASMSGSAESFESSEDFELDEDGELVFPEDPDELVGEEFSQDPFDFEPPDFTTIGVISLVFGAGYAFAGLLLSRRGLFGAGTPFALASIAALASAVLLLAPELEQIGIGVLSTGIGLALAVIGAASSRRVTTWIGGAGVAVGLGTILQDAVEEGTASEQSAAFMVLGVVVVLAGHLLATAVDEPDEEVETATFAQTRREPGASPAPEDVA